jgi:hypothetical protein
MQRIKYLGEIYTIKNYMVFGKDKKIVALLNKLRPATIGEEDDPDLALAAHLVTIAKATLI